MIPKSIFIEPTGICNLNCIFCAHRFRRNKGTMENDFFKDVCEQVINIGIPKIDISPFTGEIFTDPLILEKMEILEKSDIKKWSFFTNLTLLDEDTLKEISKFKKLESISISINGEGLKSFKFLTGGTACLFNNILTILESIFLLKSYQIHIYLKLLNLNYKRYWYEKDLTVLIYKNSNKIDYITQQFEIDDWDSHIDKVKLGSTLSINNSVDVNQRCRVLDHKNIVYWNGDFHLCGCRDNIGKTLVYNLKHFSLVDIYKSDKLNQIKNSWKEICVNCGHFR